MNRRRFLTLGAATLATLLLPPDLHGQVIRERNGVWTIKRDWDIAEAKKYGEWFHHIYQTKKNGNWLARGAKIPHILQSKEMNLLLDEKFSSDNNAFPTGAIQALNSACHCGSFPFLMHLYYSAVRGLPAIYSQVDGPGDIRYSRGNHPIGHHSPLEFDGGLESFINAAFLSSRGGNNFTTGNVRTAPDLEKTDTVPVRIDRVNAIPGLGILYNPDGHCLALAGVKDNGDTAILDAHPDHSITSAQNLASLMPVTGSAGSSRKSWYAGFRMIRLSKLETNDKGDILGIRMRTNKEMEKFGYSIEQYLDIIKIANGEEVEIRGAKKRFAHFPSYAQDRLRLETNQSPYRAIHDLGEQLERMFQERERFVQDSWKYVLTHGAITLPDTANIYQASGAWEEWSSPSSDCDRKTAYLMGVEEIERLVKEYPRQLDLRGLGPVTNRNELIDAILVEYKKVFDEKGITYTSSNNKSVRLSLREIVRRLPNLSFDPNHAPELRWGADPHSEEAKGYIKRSTPLSSGGSLGSEESYALEQNLRNRTMRQNGRTSLHTKETAPEYSVEKRLLFLKL